MIGDVIAARTLLEANVPLAWFDTGTDLTLPMEESEARLAPLATVLSWIPLYTPFTMMNRASADPPLIDKVGTLVVLIAFTAFTLWAVGRIFRTGILRTGQPPKFRELFAWLKAE